jgi:hypothetical protein
MDIRRIWLCRDVVLAEGGLPALMRVTGVAACAVIANPFSGRPTTISPNLFRSAPVLA